jgi:hypothetical protein
MHEHTLITLVVCVTVRQQQGALRPGKKGGGAYVKKDTWINEDGSVGSNLTLLQQLT